jgi:hypothetical protein
LDISSNKMGGIAAFNAPHFIADDIHLVSFFPTFLLIQKCRQSDEGARVTLIVHVRLPGGGARPSECEMCPRPCHFFYFA